MAQLMRCYFQMDNVSTKAWRIRLVINGMMAVTMSVFVKMVIRENTSVITGKYCRNLWFPNNFARLWNRTEKNRTIRNLKKN